MHVSQVLRCAAPAQKPAAEAAKTAAPSLLSKVCGVFTTVGSYASSGASKAWSGATYVAGGTKSFVLSSRATVVAHPGKSVAIATIATVGLMYKYCTPFNKLVSRISPF